MNEDLGELVVNMKAEKKKITPTAVLAKNEMFGHINFFFWVEN